MIRESEKEGGRKRGKGRIEGARVRVSKNREKKLNW